MANMSNLRTNIYLTYTDILTMDTGLESADFKSAMGDKKAWKTIVIRGHHST